MGDEKRESKKKANRVIEVGNKDMIKDQKFPKNEVKTTKYTPYNFLFKNLFAQFRKLSNFYFLIIMFMQMVETISISNGQPAMALPLVAVVAISMSKDAFEEIMRYREDKKANNDKCT